jgi:hypothetical protein
MKPPDPLVIAWQGQQLRVRHDDPHLGPYTHAGQVIRAAVELASDVEGLRLMLETASATATASGSARMAEWRGCGGAEATHGHDQGHRAGAGSRGDAWRVLPLTLGGRCGGTWSLGRGDLAADLHQ